MTVRLPLIRRDLSRRSLAFQRLLDDSPVNPGGGRAHWVPPGAGYATRTETGMLPAGDPPRDGGPSSSMQRVLHGEQQMRGAVHCARLGAVFLLPVEQELPQERDLLDVRDDIVIGGREEVRR